MTLRRLMPVFFLLGFICLWPVRFAQARLEWPAQNWQGERTEKFLKLGPGASGGRDLKGRVRRWRLGDFDRSWVGEDRTTLTFQGRTVRTKVRHKVDHWQVSWPWQPLKGHRFSTGLQEWEVRMDEVVIGTLKTNQLPVTGRLIRFADQIDLGRGRTLEARYAQGTLRLTPPGRNKLSFSTLGVAYGRPFKKHWRLNGFLERGQSQVIGAQWRLSLSGRYTHPKAKYLYLALGGDAYSSGLPVYDAEMGGPSSLMAFVYKSDPVQGPKVASLYEKAVGVLWFQLGAEVKF